MPRLTSAEWLDTAAPVHRSIRVEEDLDWMDHTFRLWAIGAGLGLHASRFKGILKDDGSALHEGLERLKGTLVYRGRSPNRRSFGHAVFEGEDTDAAEFSIYVWREGILRVCSGDAETSLRWSCANPELADALMELATKSLDPNPPRAMHVLVEREGSLDTRPATRVKDPLLRANYTALVLDGFDHVAADIQNPSPCGRFVLIDGPPGTGKSHLLSGLVETVPNATFLIVPSSFAGHLGEPRILPILFETPRARNGEAPLVLLIEDADSCLVPRQSDNANAIAGLLNASDGLLGSALNLWIVATTNARHTEVDRALLRPGRLCRRIQVDPLGPVDSARVYGRLTGSAIEFRNPTPLADIYALARGGS